MDPVFQRRHCDHLCRRLQLLQSCTEGGQQSESVGGVAGAFRSRLEQQVRRSSSSENLLSSACMRARVCVMNFMIYQRGDS